MRKHCSQIWSVQYSGITAQYVPRQQTGVAGEDHLESISQSVASPRVLSRQPYQPVDQLSGPVETSLRGLKNSAEDGSDADVACSRECVDRDRQPLDFSEVLKGGESERFSRVGYDE